MSTQVSIEGANFEQDKDTKRETVSFVNPTEGIKVNITTVCEEYSYFDSIMLRVSLKRVFLLSVYYSL